MTIYHCLRAKVYCSTIVTLMYKFIAKVRVLA